MKKTLKMMSFFAIAFCTLWIGNGVANAANFKIDVINGQDGSGTDYGKITTVKHNCTVTPGDTSASTVITINSGEELFVEVNEGCSQGFLVEPKEGYEVESVLMDRQYVEISTEGLYTFNNITADHALCVKYKLKGTPSAPNTGDVSYVLPVAGAAVISLVLMIVIARKRRSVKA